MLTIREYAGINVKVQAMSGGLLKKDDFYQMSQLKTVEEVIQTLRGFQSYAKVLSTLEQSELRRGFVEQRLKLSLADDFERLYTFILDAELREYLDAIFLKNEIDVIKLLLTAVYDKSEIKYSLPELNKLLGKKMKIDVQKLKNSQSIDIFIDNLAGSKFFSVLKKKYADDIPTLFTLEKELDLYYYIYFWELQKKYRDRKNKKVMETVNGLEIDLRNILWVYRLKKHYNINDGRIYAYLIPIHHNLSKNELQKMAEAATTDELEILIKASSYGKVITDFSNIENCITREMLKVIKKAEKEIPDSLSSVVAYMFYKSLEIKNIVTLIEGIRYNLPKSDIISRLVLSFN